MGKAAGVKLNVRLLGGTALPAETIALGGRLCYSDANIDELAERSAANAEKFVNKLVGFGHLSPIEHASFTFGIEGVSRTLLAQITRHRIASFSVQSQRYVTKDALTYILPPTVARQPEAEAAFRDAMERSFSEYEKLLSMGIPAEDARFVLPGAAETRMILTMNARELMHFFELRCCNRAQWEIRTLAWCMLGIAQREASSIFNASGPCCVAGGCSEGGMSCGRAAEVRSASAELDKLAASGATDAEILAWAMQKEGE